MSKSEPKDPAYVHNRQQAKGFKMGFQFRKSKKIAPGIRLNFTKNGIGISGGIRGARISRSATGRRTASLGIPGSGMSYRKSLSSNSNENNIEALQSMEQIQVTKPRPKRVPRIWATLLIAAMAIASFIQLFDESVNPTVQDKWIQFVVAALFTFWALKRVLKRRALGMNRKTDIIE